MNPLTPRQLQVFNFISKEIDNNGMPPTVREIAGHFKIFPKAVQDHLSALERKGAIRRARERARGLIVEARQKISEKFRIPILGRVPAGMPVEAIAEVEDYLAVDEAIAKRANFALRVKGDSMSPQILDGDVVLVESTPVARDGDVVVASIDAGEATIKKLRMTGRETFLEPTNPDYPILRGESISIIGRVTSLIRTYF